MTGREAVDIITGAKASPHNGDYHLILMDLQMPDMGGTEAAIAIRAHEDAQRAKESLRPPAYIVCMTANVLSDQVDEGMAGQMEAYMPKPLRKQEFNRLMFEFSTVLVERFGQTTETATATADDLNTNNDNHDNNNNIIKNKNDSNNNNNNVNNNNSNNNNKINVNSAVATPHQLTKQPSRTATDTASYANTRRIAPVAAQDFVFPKGLNVLLCEDNQINIKVASAFLTKLNAPHVVAVNGLEAVEIITGARPSPHNGNYHLILMDIQMPVMDGTEATLKIRAYEQALKAQGVTHAPMFIVCMTANVLKDQVDECMSGSMDAYMPKPLRKKEFNRLMEEYTLELLKRFGCPDADPDMAIATRW
ncbi:hypothetical protein SARC_00962 [Sphaeroforma arctica JP610]|uniref:Response regulatory domain-containing protein n=1 Tax=Sphaeroforma arctica JP610 TaxID=667725 RepID=A0A0L0GD22_9EUKA|nr:hypothetical protein SARC_00962 [Sphaeroforma arctica JP610]KNC86917.1 hypothetical protein SARC_00962 [Sphaeroforma arctica JP610]|eukprot:XP_014160819.1 hypothetical protein SARC_00962 [Sphaeroforma arctica JP610]